MLLPVCILSPVCSSDIVTDLPFSRVTLAVDGKQPPPDGGGGEGDGAIKSYYSNRIISI